MAIDYFTEAELRALPQMSDTQKYTTARVEAAAAYVAAIIERVVGTSFIERTVTGEVHDGGVDRIIPRKAYAREITAATDSGEAVTDTLSVDNDVVLRFPVGSYFPTTWSRGIRNVTITYTYGYSTTPPADIKEAALKATRLHLLASNSNAAIDERRTSMSNEMGVVNFVTAGAERPTGYPEVDAVIIGWRDQLNGPSVG